MADTVDFRTGLPMFLQRKISTTLKSNLFKVMPTLEFMFALTGNKTGADGMGVPKADVLIGAANGVAKTRRQKIMSEREYKPIIQKSEVGTNDIKVMGDYDSDPVVQGWDSTQKTLDMFAQPAVKFCRMKMPYKVAHSAVRTARDGSGNDGAQAAAAIRSVYYAEVTTRLAVLYRRLNKMLWGTYGTGYPTSETAVTWDAFHSLPQVAAADNTYCGVDRSSAANAWWRGNTVTTMQSKTFAYMIDYCNYDLGMIDYGLGVQIMATDATLFKAAKAEATAAHTQVLTSGIPEYPEFGFKREIVRIYSGERPVYIYYDPECPAGVVAALDPSTWTIAFAPDGNFKISKPSDQTLVEGGDEADTGTINVELLAVNEVPKAMAYMTGVTHS